MIDPNFDDPVEERDDSPPGPDAGPAISSDQPTIVTGVAAAYAGRAEDANHEPSDGRDLDQESHVRPTDNDGETVPRDEVVDQVGG